MPELPEVETVKRGIEPHLKSQIIEQVRVHNPKLRWPVNADLAERLNGAQVNTIRRRAKYLIIDTSQGYVIIHLGMTGRLYFVAADKALAKHDHVDFLLSSGKYLRYTDPRKFGAVLWSEQIEQHPLLIDLGIEPLSDEFDADYLAAICHKRSAAIKQVIMNANLLVGVGNIYAAEALFKAGIHPMRAAGKISKPRIEKLVIAIKAVLLEAIEQGGTSIISFLNGDSKPGYFQQKLAVYARAGRPCVSCQKPLKLIRQQNRSTVYCAFCQR